MRVPDLLGAIAKLAAPTVFCHDYCCDAQPQTCQDMSVCPSGHFFTNPCRSLSRMALSLLQQTLFNGGVLMAVLLAILGAVILFISTLVKMSPLSIVSSIFSKSPGRLSLPFDGRLSDTTRFTESDQVLDLKRARLWHKFCQFAPGPSISSTYSFPLITASIFKNVVASDAFPLSILGIVHARQEIEQFLPMTDATGAYDYVVSCTAARLVETGAECDVTLEVFAPLNGGKLMNRTVMTCISTDAKKAKKARKARKVLTEKEKVSWAKQSSRSEWGGAAAWRERLAKSKKAPAKSERRRAKGEEWQARRVQ